MLEALEGGFYNLLHGIPELGIEQLSNGITSLKNGMLPEDIIQENLDDPVILNKPSMLDFWTINMMRLALELLELVILYFAVLAVVIGVPLGLFWLLGGMQ